MKYLFLATIIVVGIIIGMAVYDASHPCKISHTEIQYQVPPSVVVGGSKYGGGVGIPMGNAKPVQVVICDER